jgi:hypothetical protein
MTGWFDEILAHFVFVRYIGVVDQFVYFTLFLTPLLDRRHKVGGSVRYDRCIKITFSSICNWNDPWLEGCL